MRGQNVNDPFPFRSKVLEYVTSHKHIEMCVRGTLTAAYAVIF